MLYLNSIAVKKILVSRLFMITTHTYLAKGPFSGTGKEIFPKNGLLNFMLVQELVNMMEAIGKRWIYEIW
jgi:hypothetical protein